MKKLPPLDITALRDTSNRQQQEIEALKGALRTAEERSQAWEERSRALEERISALRAALAEAIIQLEGDEAEAEPEEPSGTAADPPAVPDFVKPNCPKASDEKPSRKKREKSWGRRREPPTREVIHRLDRCPDCQGPVSAGSEKRRRQVIDLPAIRAEVIDHGFYGHWCCSCAKEKVASASPDALGVIGQRRFGVRVMSWVTLLHIEGRIPLRTIQALLKAQFDLSVSVGELSKLLQAVASRGAGENQAPMKTLRAAPVVHGDETSWRENGQNGYLWSFSTPEGVEKPVRYFEIHQSRAGKIVLDALGEDFSGTLVSDFYSGYNLYFGPHQRCWVHFIRDLHKLRKKHPESGRVKVGTQGIQKVYEDAKRWTPPRPNPRWEVQDREAAQESFAERLREFARPFLTVREAPEHVLAKRIDRFLLELFVFVLDPRVPPDNNAAERSVRPSVIARKISGGTRSSAGSETRATLMSLFGTWKLRGQDLLAMCRNLLLSPPPFIPVAKTA